MADQKVNDSVSLRQRTVPSDPRVTRAALGLRSEPPMEQIREKRARRTTRKRPPWENGLQYDAIGSVTIGFLGSDACWIRDWLIKRFRPRYETSTRQLKHWGAMITNWMKTDPFNHASWVMHHSDADKWERMCPDDFNRWDKWVMEQPEDMLLQMQENGETNKIVCPFALPGDLCGLDDEPEFMCSILEEQFGEHACVISPKGFEITDQQDSQWRVVLHVIGNTQPRRHSVVLSSTDIFQQVTRIRDLARSVFGLQAPIPVLVLHANVMQ